MREAHCCAGGYVARCLTGAVECLLLAQKAFGGIQLDDASRSRAPPLQLLCRNAVKVKLPR